MGTAPLLDELATHFAAANKNKFEGGVPHAEMVVNPRLRALAARVQYEPRRIELSGYHLTQPYARHVAFKALEHEMLHLWLHARGLNPGHTPLFKQLAKERDIPVWHALPYPQNRPSSVHHVYACPGCGNTVMRGRRLSDVRRSACGACCRRHNGGRFDARFVMRFVESVASAAR